MTYAAELDDIRQEVRRGYVSNALRYWPKTAADGNVAVSGTPTFEIYSPSGVLLVASANASATSVDSVTRIDMTLSTTDTASFPLLENYYALISYVYSSVTYVDTLRFDCVLEPWLPVLSLNDFMDEESDAGTMLARQAKRLVSTRTSAQHAAMLGVKAWGDTKNVLRSIASAAGRIYPRLIVNREQIRPVIVAFAMERMYLSQGGGPESPDAQRATFWRQRASQRIEELGTLDYDRSEDRVVDTTIGPFSVTWLRRAWP